jgi:hypothetical protein
MSYPLAVVKPGDLIFLEPGEGQFIVTSRDGDQIEVLNSEGEYETLVVDDWPYAQYYPQGALIGAEEFTYGLEPWSTKPEEGYYAA